MQSQTCYFTITVADITAETEQTITQTGGQYGLMQWHYGMLHYDATCLKKSYISCYKHLFIIWAKIL